MSNARPDNRANRRGGTSSLGVFVALVAAAGLGLGSSCSLNPVHSRAVSDLGPERPEDYPPESEFHRPGEPCALCHSADGPADNKFVLAGTIFWGPDNYLRRVDNAYVRVKDANKVEKCFVSNCNGNFFVRPEQFPRLTFPLLVSVERTKAPGRDDTTLKVRRMNSHIGREASCARCHLNLDGQSIRDFGSPGQIRLYDAEPEVDALQLPPNVNNGQACPAAPETVVFQCPEDRQ
jgi:hypothetical protein